MVKGVSGYGIGEYLDLVKAAGKIREISLLVRGLFNGYRKSKGCLFEDDSSELFLSGAENQLSV